MKEKEWHIWEFPEDRIRIKFKNNKQFLEENIKYFGSIKNLANILSINPPMISGWKRNNLYLPLKYVNRIVKLRNLNWAKLEKEVISYKGPNLSLEVNNPELPIKESPELFAIITHLIGDGSVNENGIPMYTNSSLELINNFDKLIKEVFGNTKSKIYKIRNKDYNYRTSKVIADLLKKFYKIDFNSLRAKFPEKFLGLSGGHIASIIRAIVDDEGHVRDNSIAIKMKNRELIKQLKIILEKIFGKNSVYNVKTKDGMYEVDVRAKYLKDFKDKIKLMHPKKQQELNYAIKKIEYRNIKHRGKTWETKNKILNILLKRNEDVNILSKKLFINKANLYTHLNLLESLGLIKKLENIKNPIYSLNKNNIKTLRKY